MEKLMQYVWQHRLWPIRLTVGNDGRRINIINPGVLNTNAGPDFTNAYIKIDDEYWCGNIEIHVRASDWYRHGHHRDPAYDSVILHVVQYDDMAITRSDGQIIPQMVMSCAADFNERYMNFVSDPSGDLPCARDLKSTPSLHISDWLSALSIERLQKKADRIALLARDLGWAEAMYITLARALGFGTNSEPFELLARTIPLKYMRRHADNLSAVEAMLFGQAGLLKEQVPDHDYLLMLRKEYAFYRAKYSLTPSPNMQIKMGRMRPQNSPHRRIASLAVLVCERFAFSHDIADISTLQQARDIFADTLHKGFWVTHCNFSSKIGAAPRILSASSIDVVIINAIIPYLYAYGEYTGSERLMEQAVDMLYSIPAEKNGLVAPFRNAGMEIKDAFTTQALIQLNKNYCSWRKCLFCRLGHRMLSSRIRDIEG